jgi:hypothetical protein
VRSEKQRLLRDVMDEGSLARRDAALMAGARILRRRRWRRVGVRGFAAMALVVAAALLVVRPGSRRAVPVAVAKPDTVHYLTDDELLALFPNTPVALAKVGDRKRLIFLNPADAKHYLAPM